ncbi:hypothetical protein ES708_28333 [subsurface metagenome]
MLRLLLRLLLLLRKHIRSPRIVRAEAGGLWLKGSLRLQEIVLCIRVLVVTCGLCLEAVGISIRHSGILPLKSSRVCILVVQKARNQQSQPPRPATSGAPSLNTLSEDRATNQFSNQFSNQYSSPNPIANYQAPQPTQQPQQTLAPPKPQPQMDPHAARLNALLATGDGQDTFGNTGDLRIPAQHTAPGTFVNSAGQGLDRLRATHTGNNPFFGQQQQQQQQFVPQQTGYLQQPSNPWGGQQQPQQGGSLIDL